MPVRAQTPGAPACLARTSWCRVWASVGRKHACMHACIAARRNSILATCLGVGMGQELRGGTLQDTLLKDNTQHVD